MITFNSLYGDHMNSVPTLDQCWSQLYTQLMAGKRIYYSNPTYFYNQQLRSTCCTILKIKQRVEAASFNQLRNLSSNKRSNQKPSELFSPYADELKARIAAYSWQERERPISQNITNAWGVTPFENWIEDIAVPHWMTAEWYQTDESAAFGDYAFMISVHTPVIIDQDKFSEDYDSAFLMTKIMHY